VLRWTELGRFVVGRRLGHVPQRGHEQGGIDGPRPLEGFEIDGDVDQGIEVAHRAEVARLGPLNAEVLGLAVDAFAPGTLGVDRLVEGAIAIQGDAHHPASFDVDVFDAALAEGLLLMVAGLAGARWIEQRTAVALGVVAVGMLKGIRGVHTQACRAARGAIGIAGVNGMGMVVERDGSDAPPKGAGLIGIPGIEGGISGDMHRKGVQDGHGLDVERDEIGDVIFIERLGELGQHDIAIVRGDGGCHTRAVAPQQFLFFFDGAIGLLLIGTFFDAQTAIGVTCGLLIFLEAFEDVGPEVVFFERSHKYA
jgi:hypothetical protein